jgi:hypothetical protein
VDADGWALRAEYIKKGYQLPKRRLFPRWLVVLFIVAQSVGIVSSISSELFQQSRIGPELWATAFLIEMPGNLLAGLVTEGPLWMTGLTLRELGLIATVLTVIFNGLIWFGIASVVQLTYRRLKKKDRVPSAI